MLIFWQVPLITKQCFQNIRRTFHKFLFQKYSKDAPIKYLVKTSDKQNPIEVQFWMKGNDDYIRDTVEVGMFIISYRSFFNLLFQNENRLQKTLHP